MNRTTKLLTPLLLAIIALFGFTSLLNHDYFTMHDDQHVARLHLLHLGLQQGSLYPRWVDTLGFGYGYPLFNFYPPLIYYVSELFHLLGFSLITSLKLMIGVGFLIGAVGMYLLVSAISHKPIGLFAALLFTMFGYRAVTVYVRGAFAEFFAMSLLPLLFFGAHTLARKTDIRSFMLFVSMLSLVILAHPLVAFPTFLYLLLIIPVYVLLSKSRLRTSTFFGCAVFTALALTAFFWLPSMTERQYTLVDRIFITELSDFRLHFIYPQQFWYSPWGFGGSLEGPFDGMSFALGKVYIALSSASLLLYSAFLIHAVRKRKVPPQRYFVHALLYALLLLSLLMTTSYSTPLWNFVDHLKYIQFPWRFLTFVSVFIAIVSALTLYYLQKFLEVVMDARRAEKITYVLIILLSCALVAINSKYFTPQTRLETSDSLLTTYDEIAWRVSRSSFDFLPEDVALKQSDLNTTIPAIDREDVLHDDFEIISGDATVKSEHASFQRKRFSIDAHELTVFRLNTFDFPGWKALLDRRSIDIDSENPHHLITVTVPEGRHTLEFVFSETPVRTFARHISTFSLLAVLAFFSSRRLLKRRGK